MVLANIVQIKISAKNEDGRLQGIAHWFFLCERSHNF